MRKLRPQFDWQAWGERVQSHADTLEPFREFVGEFFGFVAANDPPPDGGYTRRPQFGIRLDVGDSLDLAVRPKWSPPHKRYDYTQDRNAVEIVKPGEIDPEVIDLELLPEGRSPVLALRLGPDQVKNIGRVFYDHDKNSRHLRIVVDTAHRLLMDPKTVFSQAGQSGRCVCCRRVLTDAVSRTRGIGPECIRWFGSFLDSKPSDSVEKYRQQYLAETGFFPGR